MSYTICFSSPVTHLNMVRGVAVVTDKGVFAYFATYPNDRIPSRLDILSETDFSTSFNSLGDLTASFCRMNGSFNFYDYEEL